MFDMHSPLNNMLGSTIEMRLHVSQKKFNFLRTCTYTHASSHFRKLTHPFSSCLHHSNIVEGLMSAHSQKSAAVMQVLKDQH